MTTLITDDFAEKPVEHTNILYGNAGWTDSLDDATIALLVKIGAIYLDQVVTGPGWESRIYYSVARVQGV